MQKKNKTIVSVVAFILALLMILTLFSSVIGSFANIASDKKDLAELKDKLSGITSQKKNVQNELKSLNNQIDEIYTRKTGLEEEISLTREQIELTEEIISALDEDIDEKNRELAATEESRDAQYENFKRRIRAQYESGEMSQLSMLLSAGSLTELLTRVEGLSRIASYDKKLLYKLEDTMNYITELRTGLEEDKAEQEIHIGELEDYQTELTAKIVELDGVIEQLNEKVVLSQAALDEITANESAVDDEIRALSKKIAAEEEAERKRLEEEAKKNAAAAAAAAASKYTGGQMKWPLPGYYKISSDYEMRNHPITGTYSHHTGIDLPAPKNTPIVAAADGKVVAAGSNKAYGERVILSHGGGVQTLYGHMTSYCVKEGDYVTAGTVIGYVGSTGYSTGNHLHFSVLLNGDYVDPKPYVSG